MRFESKRDPEILASAYGSDHCGLLEDNQAANNQLFYDLKAKKSTEGEFLNVFVSPSNEACDIETFN